MRATYRRLVYCGSGCSSSLKCALQGAGFGFFHDIAMSENYYIALENPISMDFSTLVLRYMTGRACLAECLKYDPKKRTKIHLIPRPGRSGVFYNFGLRLMLVIWQSPYIVSASCCMSHVVLVFVENCCQA